jgi:hypothetical protein
MIQVPSRQRTQQCSYYVKFSSFYGYWAVQPFLMLLLSGSTNPLTSVTLPTRVFSYQVPSNSILLFVDCFSYFSHAPWSLSDSIASSVSRTRPFSTTVLSDFICYENLLLHSISLPTMILCVSDAFSPFILTSFAVTGQPGSSNLQNSAESFIVVQYTRFDRQQEIVPVCVGLLEQKRVVCSLNFINFAILAFSSLHIPCSQSRL